MNKYGFFRKTRRNNWRMALAAGLLVLLVGAMFLLPPVRGWLHTLPRSKRVLDFIRHPEDHQDWKLQALTRCGDTPFLFPTTGYIGYLWDDVFHFPHRHQGIDIFGGTEPGQTPVYAAYDGYLTREADWTSTVIIRHDDPLQPGRTIWTYYTHMADPEGRSFVAFPPGTHDLFVKAGTLLGYQGNYSGNPARPTGVHLHFSMVQDDSRGHYRNELDFANTLDPTPYLGIEVNAWQVPVSENPACRP